MHPIRPWNLLNVKKKHPNWLNLYLVITYGLELKVNKRKNQLPFSTKHFFGIPLFHFIKSFSTIQFHVCFLLINQIKGAKTQKYLKEILIHQKKAFKKNRKCYFSKDKCPYSTNFSTMLKINNSNLSNEKQKELKMKLGQLQEEISKASLPVSADLSNDFKSIIFETDQRKILPFMRLSPHEP